MQENKIKNREYIFKLRKSVQCIRVHMSKEEKSIHENIYVLYVLSASLSSRQCQNTSTQRMSATQRGMKMRSRISYKEVESRCGVFKLKGGTVYIRQD